MSDLGDRVRHSLAASGCDPLSAQITALLHPPRPDVPTAEPPHLIDLQEYITQHPHGLRDAMQRGLQWARAGQEDAILHGNGYDVRRWAYLVGACYGGLHVAMAIMPGRLVASTVREVLDTWPPADWSLDEEVVP